MTGVQTCALPIWRIYLPEIAPADRTLSCIALYFVSCRGMHRSSNRKLHQTPVSNVVDFPPLHHDSSLSKSLKELIAAGSVTKMFIGQLSSCIRADELFAMFPDIPILHVHVIYDKETRKHKNCAFVYVPSNYVSLFISKYHDKYSYSGMNNKLQVRVADAGLKKPREKSHCPSQSSFPVVFSDQYSNRSSICRPIDVARDAKGIRPVSPICNVPVYRDVSCCDVYSFDSEDSYNLMYYSYLLQNKERYNPEPFSFPENRSYAGSSSESAMYYWKQMNNLDCTCNECKCHVVVSNLPPEFCQDRLYSLFCAIGGVCGCRIIADHPANRYNSYGFVSFDCYQQAWQAVITRNGCVVEGRRIVVKLV